MVNRVQTSRSAVPGARPTQRLPGELYVNWPDMQLGVIDSANTARDLIPIRFFSPLTSYAVGDHVVFDGVLYTAPIAIPPGPFNLAEWLGYAAGSGVAVGPTPPTTPSIGDLWFDSIAEQMFVWDGTNWIATGTGASVVGPTPPANPNTGDQWFDDANGQQYVWDGAAWIQVSNVSTVSPTPPANPNVGDQWFNSTTGQNSVWDGVAWIATGPVSVVGPTPPANPNLGDLWFDTANGQHYVWDGVAWINTAHVSSVGPTPPANPNTGDLWFDSANGVHYIWDGTAWVPTSADVAGIYLPLAGGVMTGPITLAGDPVSPLEPVPLRMFDALPQPLRGYGDNRLINGDMRIDQRHNGILQNVVNVYTVDRWLFSATQPGRLSWQQFPSGADGQSFTGCAHYMHFNTLVPFTSGPADLFQFVQTIEADAIADLGWGTAQAKPVTLSFWAMASVVGWYSGAISNAVGTRAHSFEYFIPTANTWTQHQIGIPGDTSQPWTPSGVGPGLSIHFDLGSGANWRAPPGAWVGNGLAGAPGALSLVAIPNGELGVTGVKLEVGSVATPFGFQTTGELLRDCCRYYATAPTLFGANVTAGGTYYGLGVLPVLMRVTPTLTGVPFGAVIGFANAIGTLGMHVNNSMSVQDARIATATVTTGAIFETIITATAEF